VTFLNNFVSIQVFLIVSGTTTLQFVTIQSPYPLPQGSCITVKESGSLKITNSLIDGCNSLYGPGAILSTDKSRVTITNSTISNSQGVLGSAIFGTLNAQVFSFSFFYFFSFLFHNKT